MIICPRCGEKISENDLKWGCPYCGFRIVNYYDDDDDCFYGEEYCEDGIPDVNQGWVGENYG